MVIFLPISIFFKILFERGKVHCHTLNFNFCIRDGELLLVDSGCEYNGYSSDTTRVWPVNGKFGKAQKELYKVMLNIQENCIKVEY